MPQLLRTPLVAGRGFEAVIVDPIRIDGLPVARMRAGSNAAPMKDRVTQVREMLIGRTIVSMLVGPPAGALAMTPARCTG